MSCDQYYNDVVLLLNYEGMNGDTTTVDQSQYAYTVSFLQPAATLVTSIGDPFSLGITVAYYNHVGATNPNTGMATVPISNGAPLDLSNISTWTIECWVYVAYVSGADSPIFVFLGDGYTGGKFQLGATTSGSFPYIYATVGGATTGVINVPEYNAASGSLYNTWFHLAVVKMPDGSGGDEYQLYVNGVGQGVGGGGGAIHGPYTSWAGSFVAGGVYNSSSSPPQSEQGTQYQSCLRITSGIARYTANFTPPTAPFPPNDCVVRQTLYGIFAPATATRGVMIPSSGLIEPRVWMPKENVTVR